MDTAFPGSTHGDVSATVVPVRPVAAWLAGRIDVAAYASVAERLAWQVSEPDGRCPTLLICELEPAITIGRLGSRADVDLSDEELRSRRLALSFTGRGGGAVPHVPGQVCAALFARLEDLGLGPHDLGVLLGRFEAGLAAALQLVRCGPVRIAGVPGVFGRTGLLAAVGLAVRRGVVSHGGFVNVGPAPDLLPRVRTVPASVRHAGVPADTMGSVEAELQRRVRPQDVRSALVQGLAAAFGFPRTLVQAGFPVPVTGPRRRSSEVARRVG